MTLFGSLINSFSDMLGEQLKKQICFTLTITIITLIISIITAGSAWINTRCMQRSPKRTSIQPGLESCLMKENRRIIDRLFPKLQFSTWVAKPLLLEYLAAGRSNTPHIKQRRCFTAPRPPINTGLPWPPNHNAWP